jgi:hypothetical protein
LVSVVCISNTVLVVIQLLRLERFTGDN